MIKRTSDRCYALFCFAALLLPVSGNAQSWQQPQAGTYVTEGGWGQIVIDDSGPDGHQTFTLNTESAGQGCTLSGLMNKQGSGVVYEGATPSQCSLDLNVVPDGLVVSTSTKDPCNAYCGSNGSFEGRYKSVPLICTQAALDKTRREFKVLYDQKKYAEAEARLAPVYQSCLSTLALIEEGGLRNDYALTLYKLKNKAGCLSALASYQKDAARTDDDITEGMSPAIVEDYLSVIHAARTNIALCSR